VNLGNIQVLADAINADGLMTPPAVWRYRDEDGERYVLVDGHRRLAAIGLLRDGWTESRGPFPLESIMCVVYPGDLNQVRMMALTMRLNPQVVLANNRGDEAVLMDYLMHGRSPFKEVEIRDLLGVSQPWVSNSASLNNYLSAASMLRLREGRITKDKADSLAKLTTVDSHGHDVPDATAQALALATMTDARLKKTRGSRK
jgi:hypothetical protein